MGTSWLRASAGVAGVLLGVVTLGGCSTGEGTASGAVSPSPTASASVSASASESVGPPDRAREPRTPQEGACYRLSYGDALAPTAEGRPVDCAGDHDAVTFAVGRLDTVERGHLLAVDAARVIDQAAERCPTALPGFVGGSPDDLRLSMLRAVWFTPTVEQSDTGAEWYRCDVTAVGSDEELAPLGSGLRGILDREDGAAYGMCGTAAPDDQSFERVVCNREHSWRAISVVDLGAGDYPGEAAVRDAGQAPCEDAGRSAATDPLDFAWGYEWPTQEQWASGETFGRCWAPD